MEDNSVISSFHELSPSSPKFGPSRFPNFYYFSAMAHALRTDLIPSFRPSTTSPNPRPPTGSRNHPVVRCGRRDNRGPLLRGRILSIEAIQAIQSLKRAHRSDPTSLPALSRLIKSDLLAALRELLRQDECALALHVLSTLRAEYPPVDLNLYADVVNALTRTGLRDEIDALIRGLDGVDGGDGDKGLVRLLKAVVGGGRREAAVRICGLMMKEKGRWRGDEYVLEVLTNGLRRLGETQLAEQVEGEFGSVARGSSERQGLRV